MSEISRKDKDIIRRLATIFAQYAHSERNAANIADWKKLNSLQPVRPMIMMDQLPWHELNIDDELTLCCEDPFLRSVEKELRQEIYKWKHMDTDQTLPFHLSVPKAIHNSGVGVNITEHTIALDENNDIISHQYIDQLETEEQLEALHNPVITHDEAETKRRVDMLEAIAGDILPVKARGLQPTFEVWDVIAQYRSITSVLVDFLDRPEFMHRMVRRFTDFEMAKLDQLEALNLLELNPQTIHCSGALTDELPAEGFDGLHVRAKDCWAYGMGQLFATCSKETHDEFEIEYAKEYYSRIGLVYYGCCEPLHNKVDIIRKLPNVRKISISPWADPFIAAQNIGRDYVLSRKPSSSYIAGDSVDEEIIRSEIRKTLDACREYQTPCEFILKDVSTVQYQPQRLFRWSEIVREEVSR